MSKPELSDIAIELACIGIDALIFGVIYKINRTHKKSPLYTLLDEPHLPDLGRVKQFRI